MPPATPVAVSRASAAERALLQQMLELYQHDLSDLWDQDLDAQGQYGYALDRYWGDGASTPYVFRVDGQAAGFALVDDRVKVAGGEHWMDQFFVMKKYRRRGVGAQAAVSVLRAHPGWWQVGQMAGNQAARSFWLRVIAEFSTGHYTEVQLTSGWWQGHIQCFQSTRPP